MPLTDTGLLLPTFLSAKLALVYASVRLSPDTWSLDNVTVAVVVPSYTLFTPVAVTVSARAVMFAVVDAVILPNTQFPLSVPLIEIPLTFTVLPVPTFLSTKLALLLIVITSSNTRRFINVVSAARRP